MNNGAILINTGIGFAEAKYPFTVSFDYALPIAGLPFTIGLITGFFSEDEQICWPIAGRIGYHFSFNVPRLDPYMLLTLGGIYPEKGFWFGLSAGARYFFFPHFGVYAELGIETVQIFTFGLAFKF